MRLIEFRDYFPDEEACERHVRKQREEKGITCKKCGGTGHYWLAGKKMWQCKNNSCRFRTSLKSGTVMENSKLSMEKWYLAMHLMTSSKNNMSALEMQRQIGLANYQPVFEMMHKLRIVMGKREDEYSLDGEVEIDEGFFSNSKSLEINEFTGEQEELKRGKGSQKKTSVFIMHSYKKLPPKLGKNEYRPNSIPKYIKMSVLEKINTEGINKEMKEKVEETSDIVSDDNNAYGDLQENYKSHTPHKTAKVEITKILPWVHKAITNMKGILANVYKGISEEYMQNYMNEFCFKFNRRGFGTNIFDRLMVTVISYQWT